ncbi:MAG TPA: UbiA-like polyprenyltransferase [Phycisphaerae bacterium]|nr:UbiA-like polyprenyltransferase [Phycisphaerae bacterium]
MEAMPALASIRTWGEMVKFSHSVFALPFALIATFLAGAQLPGGRPSVLQFTLIVVCMVTARSFAMTFNRIADARIDARNPRTANRPIPAGKISSEAAWRFLGLSGLSFLAGCAGFFIFHGNHWPLLLAVPTLIFLAAYSYAKRFTMLAHYFLGAAIAFAPTAAWLAIDPASVGLSAALLSGTVLFWIAGFDIIYACQDVDIDRRDGLFSIPAQMGVAGALTIARVSHGLAMVMLVVLGLSAGLGWLYWAATGMTALLLAVEHSLVKSNDLSKVNLAFFTVNGIISLVLGIATIADVLWISPTTRPVF